MSPFARIAFVVVVASCASPAFGRPGRAAPAAAAPAESAPPNEIVHVVQAGQYLSLIAKRYHTTAEAIRKNNGLSAAAGLRPGMTLRIIETPEHRVWREHLEAVEGAKPHAPKAPKADAHDDKEKEKDKPEPVSSAPDKWAKKPARPGYVQVARFNDAFRGALRASNGKLVPKSAEKLDWMLRSYKTNEQLRIDRRLFKLLSQVSDHFGGRQIVVVSGFRPYSPKQFTKNSRHNHGQAIDFRIAGVPNLSVYDYCLTFPQVGCGYYPNSSFIHMDVRVLKTKWIDYSGPGQAPIYAKKPIDKPDDDDDDPEPEN